MIRNWVCVLALAAAATGCGLEDQAPPNLTGPSEFALSLTVSASADRLPRDGAAQSTITVIARNETGSPATNRRIRLSASGPANTVLSASEVVTGSDGRASFSVTAPPSSSIGD